MLRARRLVSIAVVAVLGLAALAGCRSDPSVAAYVGSTSFADAQVIRLADEYLATVPAEQRANVPVTGIRNQVVHILVLDKLVGDYVEAKGIKTQEPDVAGVAQQQGLDPDKELAKVLARYSAQLSGLSGTVDSVAPTEADQREAYDHATLNNQPLDAPFADVRQYFDENALGRTLGLRQVLADVAEQADVTLNPRYSATYQLPVQIQNASSWFGVQLGSSAPVSDAPLPPVVQQGTSGQG